MLMTLRERWRSRTADDAGLSLIELIVAMGISTIVGALALSWFVSAGAADGRATDASIATAGANTTLQSWSNLLRVAGSPTNPGLATGRVVAITPTSITFNANLAALPYCDAGACTYSGTTQVTLAIQSATVSGVSTRQLVQTLTSNGSINTNLMVPSGAAMPTGANCLFTAYDTTGTNLGCNAAGQTTPLNSIAGVGFSVVANSATGSTPQTFTTTVTFSGQPS